MDEPIPAAAAYTTDDGFKRYYVTAVVDQLLFHQLEHYRNQLQLSRSDAIRRILLEHLSRQLTY